MPSTPDDPLQSPRLSESEKARPELPVPKHSTLSSVSRLPYRRSNASLSSLFASTTSLPTARTPTGSGAVTPTTGVGSGAIINGDLLSPGGSTTTASIRSSSPAPGTPVNGRRGGSSVNAELKELILRAFSPHVSILASPDTEELVRHKGIHGGLLELLRPFGEHVQGKVTIRDGTGVSRSWEDFGVKFMGVRDGLENPRPAGTVGRSSVDSGGSRPGTRNGQRASIGEYKPARLRSGGDVPQIEELVERHLTFAEENSAPQGTDYINPEGHANLDPKATSPFYKLYLRRLLSGMPLVPSETLSHPVALVIAISSRSPAPIEELRNLYASSNTGDHRLPQWVHNEFLRYYVLVHDEDYDDITKSMTLYEQMKRHFGLHCHLLRLRSTPCTPSTPDMIRLPTCEWTAAAEELAEIVRRETMDEDEDADPIPCIHEADAQALRAFVRELVTQSVIPSMERASATWNDQVASRRRGLSGRFMSLSKRFTFGGGGGAGGNRSSTGLGLGGTGGTGNYDSLQGFYRPDAPEAIMRKLADYALMLRDWKLAQATFEVLCADFKGDKAWRYYAGANEMAVVSSLLAASSSNSANAKIRVETIENYLDSAYYSYITRATAPYNALRALLLGVELLKMRSGLALDEAAKWATRILDDRLVGPVGHVLISERIASCYREHRGSQSSEDRKRKAAFWNAMAADAWLRLEKGGQAEKCLSLATELYGTKENGVQVQGIRTFLQQLRRAVEETRVGPLGLEGAIAPTSLLDEDEDTLVEPLQGTMGAEQHTLRSSPISHRKSLSTTVAPAINHGRRPSLQPQLPGIPAALQSQATGQTFDPLGAVTEPLSPGPTSPRSPGLAPLPMSPGGGSGGMRRERDDGFE